jgi:hypothetical protein
MPSSSSAERYGGEPLSIQVRKRSTSSPSEHDELMSQDEQLDVFSEFAAPAADQWPQHSREGEIGELKEHARMLPSSAAKRRKQDPRSLTFIDPLRSPARSGICARA